MNRPTFVRRFKRQTGRSISEFLIELRLQSACRELAETERRVLEIAPAGDVVRCPRLPHVAAAAAAAMLVTDSGGFPSA